MYNRIPTKTEQRRTEWRYGKAGTFKPLGMFQKGHEHLAEVKPIPPDGPLPSFLRNGANARGKPFDLFRRTIHLGAMLSYTRSFDVDGRTFLLSVDLTVVPADRVRPFRRSTFRGVKLGSGLQLPLGWFRKTGRPQYRLAKSGKLERTGKNWPQRSWVKVLANELEQDGQRFVEVVPPATTSQAAPTGARLFANTRHVTVARRLTARPFSIKPGSKWIVLSITAGTLVAYEDLTPVYTTLMSPGQGGVPMKGRDPVKFSTTPLGTYRITFKDRAATMSPEKGEHRKFWIADVPFTQYFNPPFALHGTFWHEKFGQLMSAGCINVSPIDAQELFDWTDPPVPDGWQGATGTKANGPLTAVVVRR